MRTIKTLGIATAMALALIAFAGAGAASANYFKAAVEPETWNGSLSGTNHHLVFGGEYASIFNCTGVGFSGETKAKTLSSVTVSPSLSSCEHAGGKGSWKMNGCKYRFNPGPGPALVGTMDIAGCVEPMRYEIVGTPCFVEIGNQNGLGKVTYQNTSVGGVPALKVIAKLTGIKYTQNGKSCNGSPNGTFSDGVYEGDWIVKGATIPGGAAAGVEVESAPLPSAFTAEEYPATISGIASFGTRMFNFLSGASSNGEIWCNGTTYSGAIAAATEVVSLAPSFQGCSVFYPGPNETIVIPDKDITAGGCSYLLNRKGGFGIAGASCAASPITITVPGCVYKVGPQGGPLGSFPGPTFQNSGSGTLRKVMVVNNLETKGLTYTAEGTGCPFKGTIAGASPKPQSTLSAKTAGGAAQGFWVQ